jgi:mono/diheme cytochrome c family protein
MRITLTTLALAALFTASVFGASSAAYDKGCKSCHGPDGTPNPAIAKMMKVDMKDLKSPEVQAMSAADIKTVITDGKGKMKGVKTLSPAEADEAAAYVHSLKK